MENPAWWTTVLVMGPLLAATLGFLLNSRSLPWLPVFTAGSVLFSLFPLTAIVLEHGAQTMLLGGWEAPLGINWYVDGLSLLMLWLSGLVGSGISLYALGYFGWAADNPKPRLFWPLWLLLWSGLNALFLSADIFNLYVTLEILTLAAVPLIVLSGGLTALQAGMRYLIVALFASALYLLGVALFYAQYGTLDLTLLSEQVTAEPVTFIALMLLVVGLITKSALFPLHFWLPPAHSSAPAPVSALLSALVVKSTLYLMLRFWLTLTPEQVMPLVGLVLGLLGAAAILWGSLHALMQARLKLIVAYSTVAQLGYMFLLFALVLDWHSPASALAWQGGVYQALSHGFAKAAMFMAAGNILFACKTDEFKRIGGALQRYPITLFAFAIGAISIMGMPPSGGFVAKWLLLNAAFSSEQWGWIAVILIGGLLSAGYTFRILRFAFSEESELTQAERDLMPNRLPFIMELMPLLLAIAALLLGIFTYPLSLLEIASPFTLTGSSQ